MKTTSTWPVALAFLFLSTLTALAQDVAHVPPDQALKQNDKDFALGVVPLSATHPNEYMGGDRVFVMTECGTPKPWRVLIITKPGSEALSSAFPQAQATGMLVMPSDQVEVVEQANATGVSVRRDTGKRKFVLTTTATEAKKINDALAKAKAHHH